MHFVLAFMGASFSSWIDIPFFSYASGYEPIDIRCISQGRVKHPSWEMGDSVLLQICVGICLPNIIETELAWQS